MNSTTEQPKKTPEVHQLTQKEDSLLLHLNHELAEVSSQMRFFLLTNMDEECERFISSAKFLPYNEKEAVEGKKFLTLSDGVGELKIVNLTDRNNVKGWHITSTPPSFNLTLNQMVELLTLLNKQLNFNSVHTILRNSDNETLQWLIAERKWKIAHTHFEVGKLTTVQNTTTQEKYYVVEKGCDEPIELQFKNKSMLLFPAP